MDVFWFPRLGVWEILDPEVLYLFLCAFILFMLARNAINYIVYFQKIQLGCLLSKWSVTGQRDQWVLVLLFMKLFVK
jgi:hypothetical protein